MGNCCRQGTATQSTTQDKEAMPHDRVGEYLKREFKSKDDDNDDDVSITVEEYLKNKLATWQQDIDMEKFIFKKENIDGNLKGEFGVLSLWTSLMETVKRYLTIPRVFLLACYYDMEKPDWDELLNNLAKIAASTKEHLFDNPSDIKVVLDMNDDDLRLAKANENSDRKQVLYIGASKISTLIFEDGSYIFRLHSLAWQLLDEIVGRLKHVKHDRKDSFSYLFGHYCFGGKLFVVLSTMSLTIVDDQTAFYVPLSCIKTTLEIIDNNKMNELQVGCTELFFVEKAQRIKPNQENEFANDAPNASLVNISTTPSHSHLTGLDHEIPCCQHSTVTLFNEK